MDYEDLFQEANVAFLEAIRLYDPKRGTRFSTFVVSFVRGRLANYVRRRQKEARELAPFAVDRPVEGEHALPAPGKVAGLDRLSSVQRYVIECRYGLDGLPEQTLQAIALSRGLPVWRVRELEESALEILRGLFPEGGSGGG